MQGVVLDRALEPAWMDLAMEAARQGRPDARSQVELRLRDRIPAPEGRKKTVRVISRVWLNPRPEIAPMIGWALETASRVGDSRVLHLGGLLAAYPFFGRACAVIGRALALEGRIHTGALRKALRKEWGDREVVDVSSRGVIRTLRAFDVLTGAEGDDEGRLEQPVGVKPELTPWITHALLLTRAAGEMERQAIQTAPELFMLTLGSGWREPYPFIERFSEGADRLVLRSKSPAKDRAKRTGGPEARLPGVDW